MWLLHATTKKLKYVADERQHRYAILSHTWDPAHEEVEVSFDDLQRGKGKGKAGWTKIEFSCKQTIEDGLEYIWIDTCCMNKSSSAELSEGINSMYRWYKKASVCYAYLSDAKPAKSSSGRWLSLEERLETCRWFSRGWTLQELLAPAPECMKFYGPPARKGETWSLLGLKNELCTSLARITRINRRVLAAERPLESVSVAARLSWAANRKTTRAEDRAYSLLGIFGVNMPMLYGEGDRAFIRLQEEILRKTTDQSILLRNSRAARFISEDRDVFAYSPDEFGDLGDVIRWKDNASDEPFLLTVNGLETEVRLIKSKETHYYYGVLNCRYEDELEGPLALFLERDDDVSHPSQTAGLRKFYIHHLFAPDGTGQCFGVVSLERCQHVNPEKILILKPNIADIPHPSLNSTPRVWIRTNDIVKEKCKVVGKQPECCWVDSTLLFDPNSTHSWSGGSACVEWRDGDPSIHQGFVLAFKLRNPKDPCSIVIFQPDQVPEWDQNRDLKALKNIVETVLYRTKGYEDENVRRRYSFNSSVSEGRKISVDARIPNWRHVLAEAECTTRMDELVWIIDIVIHDEADVESDLIQNLPIPTRTISGTNKPKRMSTKDFWYWANS